MKGEWTEEQIAAWVDGSLDADEAARIAGIVANDPAALQTAERIERQNGLLRAAYADTLDEPVPARLTATVGGRPTLAASRPSARPAARAHWGERAPTALAAGLALAVGLGAGAALVGLPQGGGSEPAGAATLAIGPVDVRIAAALESAASGADGAVTPLATFRTAGDGWCREFETASGAAVACRHGPGAWSVVAAAIRPAGVEEGSAGYVPAAGNLDDALGAALDALGAGPALDPDAESEAIASGWR
ncbi:MAG: anti-sigma factor family protein [Rubrimonas sp.]